MRYREGAKNFTFKLQDVQHLAGQNFAAVAMEGWAVVCRNVKAVEEEYMRREHKMDRVMERIIINIDDDDDNDYKSESTVSCDNNDDIQGVGPVISDSK